MGKIKHKRHAAAEGIDHVLLYMHLNDLEVNMHIPCDELKQRERKVNDVLTFVVLNFFFGPKTSSLLEKHEQGQPPS